IVESSEFLDRIVDLPDYDLETGAFAFTACHWQHAPSQDTPGTDTTRSTPPRRAAAATSICWTRRQNPSTPQLGSSVSVGSRMMKNPELSMPTALASGMPTPVGDVALSQIHEESGRPREFKF